MTNLAPVHHRNKNILKDVRSHERKRKSIKRKILHWDFCEENKKHWIILYCNLNVNIITHIYSPRGIKIERYDSTTLGNPRDTYN